MSRTLDFAIVGGDNRHARLAKLLSEDGHRVFSYALEKAELTDDIIRIRDISTLSKNIDCVILPIPLRSTKGLLNTPLSDSRYEINTLFSLFPTGQTVIGGKIGNDMFELAGRCGIRLFDCLEREDFTIMNSVPTAEGAISVAMQMQEKSLNGSSCLILGYGHIGKLLAAKLYGLGAKVTVSARKTSDLAWISAYGYIPLTTSEAIKNLSGFDIIFNTIPSKILGREELSTATTNTLICDLASIPGGTDFDAARELNLRTVHALSLPGKVAPATAAESLRSTVYNILNEWGK